MPLITVKGLYLSYENNQIIENLSFEIEKGDYIAVVGENGSGKTTLIKALLGLKSIEKGKIEYSYKQSKTGYLPQQSQFDKNFPASVIEVVLSGVLNKKGIFSFYNKKDRETAYSNLKKMDMEEYAEKPFSELSGGQKQRVLLARALCATDEIIFLDEPVSGLDPKATEMMYELIAKINREEKITVVMISHDIDESLKYANKILSINEGNTFFGSTEAYSG